MNSISDLKTKEVVSNIRKIREFRNYTQDYLAAKLQISQNAYSKIELGYSSITLTRLISIAEILEVNLLDIINSDGDVESSKSKVSVQNSSKLTLDL
jgi:transcriptional regulator with XRE-family HTH domain